MDLTDVIEEAKGRGLKFPLLIRFQDILRHRVESINQAFRNSIAEFNYQGKYRGVFPIKVNQLREVVEEILDAGKPFEFGLEVGSKPELFAGLALQNQIGSLIICNGYKDADFIRMALLGIKLGKKVIMVVEKLEELRQIIAHLHSRSASKPLIGIRARLLSQGRGQMGRERRRKRQVRPEHGGNARRHRDAQGGKPRPLLQAAAFPHRLAGAGHPHGQEGRAGGRPLLRQAPQDGLPDRIPRRRRRPGRGLRRQPVGLRQLDQLHAPGIHQRHRLLHRRRLQRGEGAAPGHHQRERPRHRRASQRADRRGVRRDRQDAGPADSFNYGDNEHPLVKELLDIRKNLAKLNKLEAYHDALERKEDAQHMFTLGMLDLPDKAKIERSLLGDQPATVVESFKGQAYVPEEIRKLEDSLGDQYLCNFSVFQSLLDHWALGQLFPIMPLHRLNERPTREATLVDITCDSDGQINKFIDLRDVRDTLPLHQLNTNGNGQLEPYYLGFFLMGAYQDIMGDLHNLFGRVNEVHVFLEPDEPDRLLHRGNHRRHHHRPGLASVQYDENELKRQMKAQMDEAIKSDRMKPSEAMRLLDDYERGLKEYTYLSF